MYYISMERSLPPPTSVKVNISLIARSPDYVQPFHKISLKSYFSNPHKMHVFCLWAALFRTTKCYIQVCRDESLSKTQSMSAERNLLSTVTVFRRLGVNVTDLCRNSFAEQNWYGDWQLFDGELNLKYFVN